MRPERALYETEPLSVPQRLPADVKCEDTHIAAVHIRRETTGFKDETDQTAALRAQSSCCYRSRSLPSYARTSLSSKLHRDYSSLSKSASPCHPN
jgi:hypothetical protein